MGRIPDEEDRAIVDALRNGRREDAFMRFQQKYGKDVYSFTARLVRDPHLAEDVMQETLLKVFRDLHTLKDPTSLRSWVYTVARNRGLDAMKQRARREGRTIDLDATDVPDPAALAEVMLALGEDAKALERCLGELPAHTRDAVLLHFVSEHSFEELARMLGERSDAIRMRVTRALVKLRHCVEREAS